MHITHVCACPVSSIIRYTNVEGQHKTLKPQALVVPVLEPFRPVVTMAPTKTGTFVCTAQQAVVTDPAADTSACSEAGHAAAPAVVLSGRALSIQLALRSQCPHRLCLRAFDARCALPPLILPADQHEERIAPLVPANRQCRPPSRRHGPLLTRDGLSVSSALPDSNEGAFLARPVANLPPGEAAAHPRIRASRQACVRA